MLIHDVNAATHLYHIAQEAVNNAIKHGNASNIMIALGFARTAKVRLTISDDGGGILKRRRSIQGMGLHIMNYRAKMIGGSLEVPAELTARNSR